MADRRAGVSVVLRRTVHCAAALCVASATQAFAFGPEGHSIIAEIAHRRLTPAASAQVRALLGPNVSLASIASWADDVRDERPETANWHFVNIPLREPGFAARRHCRAASATRGDCIVAALERHLAILRDATVAKRERSEALMFVVHFVGDLHQPLHVLREDRGGNDFPVRFPADPTRRRVSEMSLHQVWDFGLIRSQVWNWGAYVTRLEGGWLRRADAAALRAGSIVDWVDESHGIAVRHLFAGIEKGATLGDDYIARTAPLLDRQLGAAGVRLAALLNDALR
jgi:hypothetical protein